MIYVDSSVLVAVYVNERFSEAARRVVQAERQVSIAPLHELEIRNAFELLVGRRLITPGERAALLADFDADVAAHRLRPISVDFDTVFSTARALSSRHAARTLGRSLDLLHVAAALEAGCPRFVSADDRQLATARAAGLRIHDIKKRSRKRRS